MRKFWQILSCIILLPLLSESSSAETVTRAEASRYARIFFNKAFGTDDVKPEFVYNGKNLTTDRLFSPFYAFNRKDGGYVIISAENKAFPVLAFAKEGRFEFNKLSEDKTERLKEFAHDIELIRYDSRMPVNAIQAWGNFPEYAGKMLSYGQNEMMMPSATEFNYKQTEIVEEDEIDPEPFEFYENFLTETTAERKARYDLLEEVINPSEPVVESEGGGHFTIRFPENIFEGKVYSLNGAVVDMFTFKDSDRAVINLDREIPGFYVGLFHGESGKPYGVKLYKSR